MTHILSEEWQQHVASSISHWTEMARHSVGEAAAAHSTPSAVFKPRVFIDGDQWCALYGANLQDGVAGFGDSPAAAMLDFDRAWVTDLQPQAQSKAAEVLKAHGFPELHKEKP